MIKGIVFDLDGVITDTAEYHYLAWKSLAKKIGIDIDREFNEQLKGISRIESLERILVYGGKEKDYSEKEKETLATQKNEEYKEYIKQITPKDILPGITDFLKEAKKQGIRFSIASASKNAPKILEQLELAENFDGIVNPSDLKKGKPDPEIFIKGAEILGLTPKECVGIEDAEAGITGINEAGMFSVGVGNANSMRHANYFVEKTSELNLQTILQKEEEQRDSK
jgi:beta-phosphoglucomutase